MNIKLFISIYILKLNQDGMKINQNYKYKAKLCICSLFLFCYLSYTIQIYSNLIMFHHIITFLFWYLKNIILYPTCALILFVSISIMGPKSSEIRFFANYCVYVLWTTIVSFIVWLYFIFTPKDIRNATIGASMIAPVANILGIHYELKNGYHLSGKTGAGVIIANHQSIFDILGMFQVWSLMEKCTVVASNKVFWVWPFGLVAWLAGIVFIDRIPRSLKTHNRINQITEYICSKKAKLWIFPEGTRNNFPRVLLPFKKGAFVVAIKKKLPIIPVVYSPYYFIDTKTLYFGRGKIVMEVLEPIATDNIKLENLDEFISQIYTLMSNKNNEFWNELEKSNRSI